jgi:hypothetical protein
VNDDDRAAARAEADAAPPLTTAQRAHLNDVCRDAVAVVLRRLEQENNHA